jgi:hypothetical protein
MRETKGRREGRNGWGSSTATGWNREEERKKKLEGEKRGRRSTVREGEKWEGKEKRRERKSSRVRGKRGERGKEKKKEKKEKEREREEVGHLSHCEWLEKDKNIFSSQLGNDTWQDKIFLLLKAPNYYKLLQNPILPKSYHLIINF